MYTLNMFSKGMHVYTNKFETLKQAEQTAERFFLGCGKGWTPVSEGCVIYKKNEKSFIEIVKG